MGGWGFGWFVGTGLLTLGVLAALAAVAFALAGTIDATGSAAEAWRSGATAIALAALALIAAGASLRWCGSYCDDCCDWDEKPNATLGQRLT